MRRGVTLIELLVVAAIAVTLLGLIVGVASGGKPSSGPPPKTVQMVTVEHDDHWWILCRQTFAHHPDCPCFSRKAEASER